jgi:hypothetical protein
MSKIILKAPIIWQISAKIPLKLDLIIMPSGWSQTKKKTIMMPLTSGSIYFDLMKTSVRIKVSQYIS